jgi:hypothetical protein
MSKVITLNDEEIKKVYDRLSVDDKEMISYLAMEVEDNYKKRYQAQGHKLKPTFGPKMATELLCKLSMFLVERYGPDLEVWKLNNEL